MTWYMKYVEVECVRALSSSMASMDYGGSCKISYDQIDLVIFDFKVLTILGPSSLFRKASSAPTLFLDYFLFFLV